MLKRPSSSLKCRTCPPASPPSTCPTRADEEVRLMSGDNPALQPVLRGCVLVGVMARRFGPCPAVLDVLLPE